MRELGGIGPTYLLLELLLIYRDELVERFVRESHRLRILTRGGVFGESVKVDNEDTAQSGIIELGSLTSTIRADCSERQINMSAIVTGKRRGLWRAWFTLASFLVFATGIALYAMNYVPIGLAFVGVGTFGLLVRFGPPPPSITPGPPMGRRAIAAFLVVAFVLLVWAAVSFQWTDKDPRSIGHYVPVFWGTGFGFLSMIKRDDWRWYAGGAIIGAIVGLAWLYFH